MYFDNNKKSPITEFIRFFTTFFLLLFLLNMTYIVYFTCWVSWSISRNFALLLSPELKSKLLNLYSIYHYQEEIYLYCIAILQGWGSGFGKISDPGLCTPNDKRYLKYYKMKILDNFASLLFCFHTFGVRRSLLAVEPWIRIRSEF